MTCWIDPVHLKPQGIVRDLYQIWL